MSYLTKTYNGWHSLVGIKLPSTVLLKQRHQLYKIVASGLSKKRKHWCGNTVSLFVESILSNKFITIIKSRSLENVNDVNSI